MEIINFLDKNKNLTYEEIKKTLEEKYKLRFILDHSKKFYMIKSTNSSDFKIPLVRQCTGIIIDKESNKILHYFGEKTYDSLNNFNNNTIEKKEINIKYCFIGPYIDGYIIKIFYYKSEWIFASTKHTNVKYFKIGEISLYSIFELCILETFNNIQDFLNLLDNNYCYTFIFNSENKKINFINKIFLDNLVEQYNLTNFKILSFYKNNNMFGLNNEDKFIIIEKENNKIIKKICLPGKHVKKLL